MFSFFWLEQQIFFSFWVCCGSWIIFTVTEVLDCSKYEVIAFLRSSMFVRCSVTIYWLTAREMWEKCESTDAQQKNWLQLFQLHASVLFHKEGRSSLRNNESEVHNPSKRKVCKKNSQQSEKQRQKLEKKNQSEKLIFNKTKHQKLSKNKSQKLKQKNKVKNWSKKPKSKIEKSKKRFTKTHCFTWQETFFEFQEWLGPNSLSQAIHHEREREGNAVKIVGGCVSTNVNSKSQASNLGFAVAIVSNFDWTRSNLQIFFEIKNNKNFTWFQILCCAL